MAELLKQVKWLPTLSMMWIDVIQIFILIFVLYYLIKSLYKTRAWILVKGLMIIGAVYLLIALTEMTVLQSIMNGLFSTLLIAIVIMLQPELQKIVELIGTRQFVNLKSFFKREMEEVSYFSDKTIDEIVEAAVQMGKEKTGALIVLERGIPLKEYIQSGIEIKATVSNQLLINIFEKDTPLHDGAVMIRKNKIESATSYLPLSTSNRIDKKLGTRHRAAIGISETTDCVVVIVSEETGSVSLCEGGNIDYNLTGEQLTEKLHNFMNLKYEKTTKKDKAKTPMWVKYLSVALSLIIWIAVTMMIDPVVDITIPNVSVSIMNDSILKDNQKTYNIKSGETISVEIEGKRSIVQKVTSSEIIAKADFNELSITNAIPIRISIPSYGRKVDILNDNQVMTVEIENIVQTTLPVEVQIIGNPNKDKVAKVSDDVIEPITVNVPQSIVKTLDKAVATVDVTGYATSFTTEIEPVIYDKNGNIVDSSKMTLAKKTVMAGVDMLETKSIPLKVELKEQGKNEDVYFDIKDYTVEQKKIKIAIEENAKDINELVVSVLPDVNSENINTLMIDLKQYLPEGVYLAGSQDDKIAVEFDLIKYQKQSVAVTKANITLDGYDKKKFNGSIMRCPDNIEFYYDAAKYQKADFSAETLKLFIKSEEDAKGTYSATLKTDLEGIVFNDEYIVKYNLRAR